MHVSFFFYLSTINPYTPFKMRTTLALTALGLATGSLGFHQAPACPTTQLINGVQFPTMIDVTLEDLVFGLETGLFNSTDLVQTYMDRILEVNSTLHMVTELNPDALTIAAQYDAMRANGSITGPLHGIPVLIKNNIATDDLMNNTGNIEELFGCFNCYMNTNENQLDPSRYSVLKCLVTQRLLRN